jgi:hypothetical protein
MGQQWLTTASYIGNHVAHIWGVKALNPAVYFFNGTATCTLPNGTTITGSGTECSTAANTNQRRKLTLESPEGAKLGRLVEFDTDGTQDYEGLRLSLERRAPRDVSVSANYTLSKCLQDFTSDGQPNVEEAYLDPNNRKLDRGNCAASRRHVFNLTTLYETPMFPNRALRILASEWRLAGIYRWASGDYLTVTTGVDRALTDIDDQRPDRVAQNPYKNKSGRPLTQFLDPAAFALPAVGTNGNERRASIEGPHTWQFDLALSRLIRLGTQSFEFRAEAYNLTNSFRPGDPATDLSSGTFGQIRTALDPRILQFALKYGF